MDTMESVTYFISSWGFKFKFFTSTTEMCVLCGVVCGLTGFFLLSQTLSNRWNVFRPDTF